MCEEFNVKNCKINRIFRIDANVYHCRCLYHICLKGMLCCLYISVGYNKHECKVCKCVLLNSLIFKSKTIAVKITAVCESYPQQKVVKRYFVVAYCIGLYIYTVQFNAVER